MNSVVAVKVYTFTVCDCEDPDLYAAEPLYQWQESDAGKWIIAHSTEPPVWTRFVDHNNYGYRYAITAKMTPTDHTYWSLKFK